MVDALASGQLDIAVAWGPTVGYYARLAKVPVVLAPAADDASVPEAFAIAIAVRDDERALREEINAALDRDRSRIDAILAQYGVPLLPLPGTVAEAK
jgi:mxaJ protein